MNKEYYRVEFSEYLAYFTTSNVEFQDFEVKCHRYEQAKFWQENFTKAQNEKRCETDSISITKAQFLMIAKKYSK